MKDRLDAKEDGNEKMGCKGRWQRIDLMEGRRQKIDGMQGKMSMDRWDARDDGKG